MEKGSILIKSPECLWCMFAGCVIYIHVLACVRACMRVCVCACVHVHQPMNLLSGPSHRPSRPAQFVDIVSNISVASLAI